MKSQSVTVSDLKKIFQSKYSSDSFYEILSGIRNLFDYDYAFIGRISPNAPDVAETLMLINGEKSVLKNFEYNLNGTPCEDVYDGEVCYHSENVANLFPEDKLLKEMGIESYLGAPITRSDGCVVGILCLLSSHPILEKMDLEDSLFVISNILGPEVENINLKNKFESRENFLRGQFSHDLKTIQHYMTSTLNYLPIPYFSISPSGYILAVNEAFLKMFSERNQSLIGRKIEEILNFSDKDQFLNNNKIVIDNLNVLKNEEIINETFGKRRFLSIERFPQMNQNGKLIAVGFYITSNNLVGVSEPASITPKPASKKAA